jgi:hypothetical protein
MEQFQIKTWRIANLNLLTEADFSWLRKNCYNVQVDGGGGDPTSIVYKGRQYQIPARATPFSAKFSTNNSKQETIVQLKFGDNIILESWVNCTTASWPA